MAGILGHIRIANANLEDGHTSVTCGKSIESAIVLDSDIWQQTIGKNGHHHLMLYNVDMPQSHDQRGSKDNEWSS